MNSEVLYIATYSKSTGKRLLTVNLPPSTYWQIQKAIKPSIRHSVTIKVKASSTTCE